MAKGNVKTYRPAPFVPTISMTGGEDPTVFRAENMWLRFSRFGNMYAEGYAGSKEMPDTAIPTKSLTSAGGAKITWSSDSTTVTGTNTTFITDLRTGSFVIGWTSTKSELFVVEAVVSDTEFIAAKPPSTTEATTANGAVMPVMFAIGKNRGTAIRGNAVQYPRGHFIGVGDGELRIDGNGLNGGSNPFNLERTPQFAIYDPAGTPKYTFNDVGIDKPLVPPTLSIASVPSSTISSISTTTPIVVTTSGSHRLHSGSQVSITGATGMTEANGYWTITKLTDTTFQLNGSIGTNTYTGGATLTIATSVMRKGAYSIRIVAKNTQTSGYSQPSDTINPITLNSDNECIRVTFNSAMLDDQDAWDIYGSPYRDQGTNTILPQFQGPWYLIETVTADMLKTTAKPTGRESGTVYDVIYSDAQVAASTRILSFNNFPPPDAEFVDLINGIPIYFSCLGRRTVNQTNGTSPGPVAVPSKPSNPEAVFLDKAVTTAGGDYIVGEFNAKSRIFVLCENTLQSLILTTLDDQPIAFRSLWNCGFRNPYNVTFVKDYLYGYSTQKFVRGVAGGDDSSMEFEYASDIQDYAKDWKTGQVLVAYDPKNRAVCHFYSAAEKRNGYWVTIVLPFMLDKQIWNPPIVLQRSDRDFIVSGVATVGENLYMCAGGRKSDGSVEVKTYMFDGGDSTEKNWYMSWNYTDDGLELNPKIVTGFTLTGRFSADTENNNNTKIKIFGTKYDGLIKVSDLESGENAQGTATISHAKEISRKRLIVQDWGAFPLYTIRIEGKYTETVDRLDEIGIRVTNNNSEA